VHAFGGGKSDSIDGGPGRDVAFVDRAERRRTRGCETVRSR
jgi:hypothetical protein